MKKETLLALMPKLILIICVGAVMGLMGYALTKKQTKIEAPDEIVEENQKGKLMISCETDSDCEGYFSYNTCETFCANKNEENQKILNELEAVCDPALWFATKPECKCVDNKCVDKIDDISNWQTYRSEKGGFKLDAPAKWDFSERISSTEEGTDLFLFFDKEATTSIDEYDYVQLNIRIKQNKLNLSMEDFYNGKQNAELFRDARGGYEEIVVGGKNAVRFKEKNDIGADVVVISLQGKFMEIDSANSNIEMFNKILPTFKFTELSDISDWKTYRNEEFGFEIKYPEEYKIYDYADKIIDRSSTVKEHSNPIANFTKEGQQDITACIEYWETREEYLDFHGSEPDFIIKTNKSGYIVIDYSPGINYPVSSELKKEWEQIISTFKFIEE